MSLPTKWNLQKYFYKGLGDPTLSLDLESFDLLISDFEKKYKGKINSLDESGWLDFLHDESFLNKAISKPTMYLFYLSSLNTQDQAVLSKEGEAEVKLVNLSNKLLFVSQEMREIGYDKLINFSKSAKLIKYKNYFLQKANSIKYLLDEKTEFALNLKDLSGNMAFNRMYEELCGSFEFSMNIDGEEKSLTEEEVRSYRMSPKEGERKEAYKSLSKVYLQKSNQIILGNTYNAIVKDWTSEIKIRGFKTVLSQRNIAEELPDEAVETLLEVVQKNFKLYQRYLNTKTKVLIKKNLQTEPGKIKHYNLYAPLESHSKNLEFEKAYNLLLNVLKKFDSEFYDFTVQMFEQERVDVFPYKGKRSGAFCSFEKDFESFVLLNYTGKLEDVSTIAHELGHAIHGYFSQKQPSQVYHSGLSLAETASVFSEMIFSEEFIKTLDDKDARLSFLSRRLEDIFATIFVQVMYASFEKEVHELISQGKDLNYTDFNSLWRKHQLTLFGDIVDYEDLDDSKAFGWSSIPHIFRSPFYVYSYAFGNILTFALYEKYLKEGEAFVQDYKNILKSGGSQPPYDLLKNYGMDITKPEFYENGILAIEKILQEFEAEVERIL